MQSKILDSVNVICNLIKEHEFNDAQKQIDLKLFEVEKQFFENKKIKIQAINDYIFQIILSIDKIKICIQKDKSNIPDFCIDSMNEFIKKLIKKKEHLIKQKKIINDDKTLSFS